MKRSIIAIMLLFAMVSTVFAKDVHVKGYYRKNGTYVRPHIRSSPDAVKWNNYGPSKNSDQLMDPRSRDNDKDGVPNYLDHDDDNDGTHDDSDAKQYSPFKTNNDSGPFKSKIQKNADSFESKGACDYGYYRTGNKCLPVGVPQNGKLDYLGHNWECERGYCRTGNKCLPVVVPQNGKLDYLGHNWECERGYYRTGNKCLPVGVSQSR